MFKGFYGLPFVSSEKNLLIIAVNVVRLFSETKYISTNIANKNLLVLLKRQNIE